MVYPWTPFYRTGGCFHVRHQDSSRCSLDEIHLLVRKSLAIILPVMRFEPLGPWPAVPVERLNPTVDIAGFFIDPPPLESRYRVRGAHLFVIIGGTVDVQLPDRKRLRAGRGDFLAFANGINHMSYVSTLRYYQVHLHFGAGAQANGWPTLGDRPLPYRVALDRALPQAVAACEAIMETFLKPTALSALIQRARVFDLLTLAFAPESTSLDTRRPQSVDWQDILLRLEREPDIAVSDLAREYGYSVGGFIQRFTRYTGSTPRQYIINRRLWHARRLLAAGAAVKEAARKSGFTDPSYFARRYRRAFGSAPSQRADDAEPTLAPLWPVSRHLLAKGVSLRDYDP
jgi:AraC-like DNA-binding protein